MKYKVIILILCFQLFSCSNRKTVNVDLDNYKKLEIIDNNLSVILIKTFPNENKCSGTVLNSNLYLCQDFETNDTIMVFEPCSEVPDFAKKIFQENEIWQLKKKTSSNIKLKM
jgi:hypothetical protein